MVPSRETEANITGSVVEASLTNPLTAPCCDNATEEIKMAVTRRINRLKSFKVHVKLECKSIFFYGYERLDSGKDVLKLATSF